MGLCTTANSILDVIWGYLLQPIGSQGISLGYELQPFLKIENLGLSTTANHQSQVWCSSKSNLVVVIGVKVQAVWWSVIWCFTEVHCCTRNLDESSFSNLLCGSVTASFLTHRAFRWICKFGGSQWCIVARGSWT